MISTFGRGFNPLQLHFDGSDRLLQSSCSELKVPANNSPKKTKPHNINLLCVFFVPKNDDSGPSSDRKKTEQDSHWLQICYTKNKRCQM